MAAPKPKVPVIVGPTAVGKTAVVEELSQLAPLAVVSADSRQIYRRLDIGTAKPERRLRESVPHFGIDLVEPGERYSAGRFAREAAAWLSSLPGSSKPVVVGGTGLYVRALTEGLFREPEMDPERRRRLAEWTRGMKGLARWASRLDPGYTGGGRQRAARVVEVALLTGRPLSWWQQAARAEGIMQPVYFRLTLPRVVLHRRIAERVDAMLDAGWVEEVEALLRRGLSPDAPGLDAVGYREIIRYLQGSLDRQALRDAIVTATRRYAKRQETWFRHQLPAAEVITLDATAPSRELAERIMEEWNKAIARCGSE
ncbi:MAG: tRNA dimethylallyltransferase [Gemmatimonadales bacterium]|nr:MAG: tRNA dimethylallyltransferase [Gemmatimonadales bacterium]